jgi:SAM-dependent methyltransferase
MALGGAFKPTRSIEKDFLLHCGTEKTSLHHFISYYSAVPWLALLRYLEVEQSRKAAGLWASPILDLGCGDGFVANQVFRGYHCLGMDIDEKPLRSAQSSGTYRLVLNADAQHLPFKDQTFGTVYSNGAMEHMSGLKAVIVEIHRVLKKGGHLITFVPSNKFLEPVGGILRLLGSSFWNAFNAFQNHVNLLSAEQWQAHLVTGGFNVHSINRYGNKELAAALSIYDLCSKLHMQRHHPFFILRHHGNAGRVFLKFLGIFKPLRMAKESVCHSGPGYYWLMVVACRPD